MMYDSFSISTKRNQGRAKLAVGTMCGQCRQPIAKNETYIVHAVRMAAMPVRGFHYHHIEHAPRRGSGWGNFQAGEQINDLSKLNVGDLLLEFSIQFDSYNVVRVTKTRWENESDQLVNRKVYGVFADPSDPATTRLYSSGEFCICNHELGSARELYRATIPPRTTC